MSLSLPVNVCHCGSLRQAARRITQFYERVLAPVRLTMSQYSILAEIEVREAAPPTVAELAEILVMDRSSLSHALHPLQRDGLVMVSPTAADRRTKPLALTSKGRAVYRKARPLWDAAQDSFERAYGAAPSLQLRETLARVSFLELAVSTA